MLEKSTVPSGVDNMDFEREPIPDTEALQFRILELSKGLTQKDSVSRIKSSSISWLPASVAVAASLLLVTFLWFPYSGIPAGSVSEMVSKGSAESFTAVELEFQEIMLLQDELLFDQL